MKEKISYLIILFLIVIACQNQKKDTETKSIIETLIDANNSKDYNKIKPFLSKQFHFQGTDVNTSFTLLYSYLNSNLPIEITQIDIDSVKQINDTYFEINGTKFYEKYKSDKITIRYKKSKESIKIDYISSLKPDAISITTRASYVNEEIFGDDPVNNIVNLKVLDKSSVDSIKKYNYTFYHDKKLKKECVRALNLFGSLDSLLEKVFQIKELSRENLYLTSIKSNNTITIGLNGNIPWTMSLSENEEINNKKLTNKIGTTFSHEIVEGTLVKNYNLNGYKYRWFRDGLADYIAYIYCKEVAPEQAEKYFIENRLSSAKKFKKNGNLLDWRANGPIESIDKGKLYGEKFIYYNEVGQYGRAFKFFKDLFENNNSKLASILKQIKKEKNITIEKVLSIMSKATNKDVEEEIGEY